MRDCTQFYIDGQWVDPVEENTVAVENPATEETIGHISFGTCADVDKAVAAARRAFESFSQTSKEERLTLLRAIQAEIETRKEELATAVSDEMGAPLRGLLLNRLQDMRQRALRRLYLSGALGC